MDLNKLLSYQLVPWAEIENLRRIYNKKANTDDRLEIFARVFSYGVIQGKRTERARKKERSYIKTS